ncbi:ABC transporter permease [Paenibacillus wulumuqiensis]|uniref:ABC transporter permease n=1 Tax=Paenibacillus wulumuqiensis TaxID=1567107 RepID=UPI000619A405|nr:ABC transporter permease [Paenibacillus wulumuqiensis]
MKKSFAKKTASILIALVLLVSFFLIIRAYYQTTATTTLIFQYKSNVNAEVQLFFTNQKNGKWNENQSVTKSYTKPTEWKKIQFDIPSNISKVRLDTGNQPAEIDIKDIKLSKNHTVNMNILDLDLAVQQVKIINKEQNFISLKSLGEDPYIGFDIGNLHAGISQENYMYSSLFLLLSLVAAVLCTWAIRNVKEVARYIKYTIQGRKLIFNLAKNDFKTKYAASYLGIIWGFIQPLITIATYWFVFQVGLRSGDISSVPFILWFIAGIIPWFFFSEALLGGTNVFMEYSYLVKKVVFKIELLPVVKIVSSLFVHLFFIAFIFIMYSSYGLYPKLFDLQLVYYLICSIVLAFSISILTSAIILFFKDLNQIIGIILQVGFWFTPIGWTVTMLNNFWAFVFKLNPMYYIVQGYRDTLIEHTMFWERPYQTLYFWIFCSIILVLGIKVFKKLKPHFSDVL